MKRIHNLPISPIREGLNLLKVYPSYLAHTTWSRPVSLNLLLTSRCNSKCHMCDSWKLTDHDHELTTDEYFRLAQESEDLDIPIVTIGGGEPTLRKDLWEIVRAFKDHGRVVQLTTNGLTLRGEALEKLLASNLDRVTISFDSHIPDVYEVIRGVNSLTKVVESLKELLREKPDTLEVDTNSVLCRENACSFLDTIDFLTDLGVPKINLSAVTTSDENYLMTEKKDELAQIPISLVKQISHGLLQRKQKTGRVSASTAFIKGLPTYYLRPDRLVYPCMAGYLTLDVWQDGSIHGCGNLPSLANVREHSLTEIWYGPAFSKTRREMAQGKCPNCYLSCKIELGIAAHPLTLPRFALDKLK